MLLSADYFQRLIDIQKGTVRDYRVGAGLLVLGGAGVITCSFLFREAILPELNKNLLTIAGGFISSLSAWPLASVTRRREKLATLELLLTRFCEAEEAQDSATLDEIKKVMEAVIAPFLNA